jgi:hypothetical protein
MAKLSEIKATLDLAPEGVDFENLPEQFAGRDPLPQPGKGVIIQLPQVSNMLDLDTWAEEETESGNRVAVIFGGKEAGQTALRTIKHPTDPASEGGTFRWRASNAEKKWDEEDGQASSTMAYLLRAVDPEINLPEGSTNMDYINAIAAAHGRFFKASVLWTGACNPKGNKYVWSPEEEKPVEMEGHLGCGQRYEMKQRTVKRGKSPGVRLAIPHEEVEQTDDEGNVSLVTTDRYAERWTCSGKGGKCGAYLGAFIELRNIQPLSQDDWAAIGQEAPGKIEFKLQAEVKAAAGPKKVVQKQAAATAKG